MFAVVAEEFKGMEEVISPAGGRLYPFSVRLRQEEVVNPYNAAADAEGDFARTISQVFLRSALIPFSNFTPK